MKVTNELREKIAKSINEKYSAQLDTLIKKQSTLRKKLASEVADKVCKIANENPEIEYFIQTKAYHQTTRSYVLWNVSYFTEIDVYKDIDMEICKLRTKKTNETNNLIIAISYERDFDGIKKAFEDAGLEF